MDRITLRNLRLIIVYGIILLSLVVAAVLWDQPEETASYGSLDGRFESDIALTIDGQTLHYRENEIVNYLLIGADWMNEADQVDYLLMLSIDRINRRVTPVMIDRDTMVQKTSAVRNRKTGDGQTMPIRLVEDLREENGGMVRAVSSLLNRVKVDRCLMLDMEGISLLSKAVGGITVILDADLTTEDAEFLKGDEIPIEGDAANRLLSGKTAEGESVQARMDRQWNALDALVRGFDEKLESGEAKLYSIMDALVGHLDTQTHPSILISEARTAVDYELMPIEVLPGSYVQSEGQVGYYVEEQELDRMVARIWFE